MKFDVVVVGAGPAGSASARWLARRGVRVVIVERTRFESERIGESLAPDVQPLLRDLGLWSEFIATAPLQSWGTRSVWGSDEPQSHSHLMSAYGCGWHVDRRAVDRMLASGAESAGATLFDGVTVHRAAYDHDVWQVQTREGLDLQGRVLVDATGRSARLARSQHARRIAFDRLVGVATHWTDAAPDERGHLLVETTAEGWWYSAPLPAGGPTAQPSLITMLMTDADLCTAGGFIHSRAWQSAFARAAATRKRCGVARVTSAPRAHCAVSQRVRREYASDTGPWLGVGDAALAVDPVSGSGVVRTLRNARAAADTIGAMLDALPAWREPVAAYEHERDEECTSYLLERAQYYALERRFATPFWRRRMGSTVARQKTAGRVA